MGFRIGLFRRSQTDCLKWRSPPLALRRLCLFSADFADVAPGPFKVESFESTSCGYGDADELLLGDLPGVPNWCECCQLQLPDDTIGCQMELPAVSLIAIDPRLLFHV